MSLENNLIFELITISYYFKSTLKREKLFTEYLSGSLKIIKC